MRLLPEFFAVEKETHGTEKESRQYTSAEVVCYGKEGCNTEREGESRQQARQARQARQRPTVWLSKHRLIREGKKREEKTRQKATRQAFTSNPQNRERTKRPVLIHNLNPKLCQLYALYTIVASLRRA